MAALSGEDKHALKPGFGNIEELCHLAANIKEACSRLLATYLCVCLSQLSGSFMEPLVATKGKEASLV